MSYTWKCSTRVIRIVLKLETLIFGDKGQAIGPSVGVGSLALITPFFTSFTPLIGLRRSINTNRRHFLLCICESHVLSTIAYTSRRLFPLNNLSVGVGSASQTMLE
jgi:uncharacterized membrane protein